MDQDVFCYRDYRQYLADSYRRRKSSDYGFSYRSFARQVGSGAPNYLKLVTDGQRNLSQDMARRFARALELKGDAAEYFCDLVEFNQAASAREAERCYRRIRRYRQYREAFRLDEAHAEYHSEWYIPTIRELVACHGFREDPKWIARRLKPNILVREAAHALEVLQRLNLITRDETGRLQQNHPIVSTGDDKPLGYHVMTFHRTMTVHSRRPFQPRLVGSSNHMNHTGPAIEALRSCGGGTSMRNRCALSYARRSAFARDGRGLQ